MPGDPAAAETQLRRLNALLEVTRLLQMELAIEELLQLIVAKTGELLDAERTTVYLVDGERGELWSYVTDRLEIREIRLRLDGPGLAAHVARTGETVNIPDVYDDPRFNPEIDRRTGWRTRAMLVMPMRNHQQEIIGVCQVMNKRGGPFDDADEELLNSLAASAAIAVENAQLYAEQRRLFDSFVETLVATLDARDQDTAGHSERVMRYAIAIARACGISGRELESVRLAAILHDLGKIAIRDAILLKPGRLTDEEYRVMAQHARHTQEILQRIRFPRDLGAVPEIAGQHHERVNGHGKPLGLAGEEITIGGRIIAVADVFDALTSRRYYKQAMPFDEVVEMIRRGVGEDFDPGVVAAFERTLPELARIHAEASRESAEGLPAD